MSRRATRQGARLTVIFWRDIPAQVRARAGVTRASAPLPERFMVAVDAAASKAGKTSTDDYFAEWREETRQCDDDLQSAVEAEAARIDEAYPPNRIKEYVRNGGWAG